jgi:hypothetical protein
MRGHAGSSAPAKPLTRPRQNDGFAAVRELPLPQGEREPFHQLALNFITLIASKFCTPPPTRLVV